MQRRRTGWAPPWKTHRSGSGLRCGWRIVFCEVNVNIIYNIYIYYIIYNILYIYVVWFSKSPTIFHSIFQTKTNTSRFYSQQNNHNKIPTQKPPTTTVWQDPCGIRPPLTRGMPLWVWPMIQKPPRNPGDPSPATCGRYRWPHLQCHHLRQQKRCEKCNVVLPKVHQHSSLFLAFGAPMGHPFPSFSNKNMLPPALCRA